MDFVKYFVYATRLLCIFFLILPVILYDNSPYPRTYQVATEAIGTAMVFIGFLSIFVIYLIFSKNIYESASYIFIAFSVTIPFYFGVFYKRLSYIDDCFSKEMDYWDPLYFSYTTYTTLGYGDITPVGLCRIFTSVEAICGYLMLGLVAAVFYRMIAHVLPGGKANVGSDAS